MKMKISIIVALIATLALGSCNFFQQKENQKNSNKKEVIKIGAILPLTGTNMDVYGEKVKKGMLLAQNEIDNNTNDSIIILFQDTHGIPKDGITVTTYLKLRGINILVGPVSSSVAEAILPYINKEKIFTISPAASSPRLSGRSIYFVRNWPSDIAEATAIANYMIDSSRVNNLGIIYVNNDYGIGLNNEIQKVFKAKGGNILISEKYDLKATDFKNIINKLKRFKDLQAIYVGGYKEIGMIIKQIKEANINVKIFACSNFNDPETQSLASVAAKGVVYALPEFYNNSNFFNNFVLNFKNKYGYTPSLFEANGYDAVKIIYQSYKKTVNHTPQEIAKYVKMNKFSNLAVGTLKFDASGDVSMPIIFKKVK